MKPITKPPRKGEHIKRINLGKTEKNIIDRNRQIENENKILFEKIRDIMQRPAYVKATLYDSKRMTDRALQSQRGLSMNKNEDNADADLSQAEAKQLESSALLPSKIIKSRKLSVSPRRLKVFHYHNIGQDNNILGNIKENRL